MSKTTRCVTVSLLAAALLVATAAPSHAWGGGWGGGRVVIGVPYWGAPYPYPYPYWGNPYGPSWQDIQEEKVMAAVFLTTEPAMVSGCTQIGMSGDDNVKDLRRKIVRAGGNTAVISFNAMEMSMLLADVFRCSTTSNGPSIPRPPAGAPPPPPPAR